MLIVHMNVKLFSHKFFYLLYVLRYNSLQYILFAKHAVYLYCLFLNMVVLLFYTEQVRNYLKFVKHILMFLKHPFIKFDSLLGSGFYFTFFFKKLFLQILYLFLYVSHFFFNLIFLQKMNRF